LRIKSLDSVRGIAAFVVVLSHCILTNSEQPRWSLHFPLSLLGAGDGAVFVFFALSGCVLFLSLQRRETLAYFAYLAKRFFRIYPTFIVAILASAILVTLVKPHDVPGVSQWFNGHWQHPPTAKMLLGHLAMTDRTGLRQLDSVMWSLIHEIRISIFFPFIALCVVMNWRAAVVVSTLVSAACVYIELHHQISWLYDPFRTLSFVFLFTAGAALASHADDVRRFLGRCPGWLQIGLWVVALRLATFPAEQYLSLATAAGALLIIALAFGTRTTDRILSAHGVLTWLGRISYSLYLVHFPILLTSVHLLHGRLPLPAIFGLVILTSLVAADVMNRVVEQPSIAFGRRVASLPALKWTFPLRRKLDPGAT